MANASSSLVQILSNRFKFLRDTGLSYGDHIEQLTELAFPQERKRQKMAANSGFSNSTALLSSTSCGLAAASPR